MTRKSLIWVLLYLSWNIVLSYETICLEKAYIPMAERETFKPGCTVVADQAFSASLLPAPHLPRLRVYSHSLLRVMWLYGFWVLWIRHFTSRQPTVKARLHTSMKICYNFNFILFFSPSLFSIHIYPSTALSNYSFRGGQTFMVEKAPSWSIWSYGADLERPRWDSMLTLSSPLLPSTVSHWTIHSKVPTERPQLGQCQNFIWKSLSHISNLFPETKLG